MKPIAKKTPRMLELESKYNMPIEELLRNMFVDKQMGLNSMMSELNVSYATLLLWLYSAGVYGRMINLGDGE